MVNMFSRKLFILGLLLLILALISNGLVRTRHYPRQTLSQDIVKNGFITYMIEPGDTWSKIAQKFGVSLEALWSSNPSVGCPRCVNVASIGNVVNIPIQSIPDSKIEVEWPTKMEVNRSDTIRISLVPINTQQVVATAEVSGHTAVAMTPLPILGTPEVPMKDAFGPSYDACIIANLQGSAFDIKSTTTETDCIPLDQSNITWDWSIYPRSNGHQSIISSVDVHWVPKESNNKIFQTQLWRYRFETDVKAPFIEVGQLNISTLISGLLSTLLSIPWIYERIKEKREMKEEKKVKIPFE